ncbi:hypothetical protein CH373_11445 [Leptospira perolatii]|uniref:Uncharacterized protein n=1 Tax=Leptospira perolatii TaxID=2023191 RepID=A0A2M9ZM69_9LEPT|nr:hypothetical protein [Leptospira perolatii]PJZ69155.1 hypothetical protein CH360_12820 [Leptospira perolatii]PJZ73101.1 hypothetical protein CH373_11445 [Leptospira perolatii]
MENILPRSFYTVEIFIGPGSARMSYLFVLDKKADVIHSIHSFLSNPVLGANYLLLFYGCDIIVQTYQNGIRTQKIDARPYIRMKIEDFDEIGFTEEELCPSVNCNFHKKWEEDLKLRRTDAQGNVEWILVDELPDSEHWKVQYSTDFEKIPIESLTGTIARESEFVLVDDHYAQFEIPYKLGSYENEWRIWNPHFHREDPFDFEHVPDDQLEVLQNEAYKKSYSIYLKDEIDDMDDPLQLNNKAFRMIRTNLEVALYAIQKALSIDENNELAYHTKAEILVAMELFNESLESIERSIELKPSEVKLEYKKTILSLMQSS